MDPQYNCKVVLSECVSSYNSVQLKKQRSKLKIERCKMQAESDESRQVIDDIDLFRMQLSYDDGDQPQLAPTLSSNSSNYGSTNSSNYGYRSRDEVANAILTLRGKEKQAEYIKAQGAPFQHSTRSVVKISKEAKELAAIANEPTYTITQAKETMKTEGLLESFYRRAFCASETQPDFSAVGDVKEYSVEGITNHVQKLKVETSSQFLSPPPPPPSAYMYDVIHHSESIGACSTMTNSVAGKIVAKDKAKDACDNTATTKSSTLSCSSSLSTDRDSYTSYGRDVQMVSKVPSAQVTSHEHVPDAEYKSLGSGSKQTFAQYQSANKSFLSFIMNVGKGSLLGSSASELGASQSFSTSLGDEYGDTFSSASGGSSEDDSDYTLGGGSSSTSYSYDESFGLASYSYASSVQQDGFCGIGH